MRHLNLIIALALGVGCGTSNNKPVGTHPVPDLAMGGGPGADMAQEQMSMDDMAMDQTGDDMAMMQQGMADMAAMCTAPGKLYPPKGNGPNLYCPFAAAMGMKSVYCQGGTQHCCEPKMGMSACDPLAMACAPTDTDWQCEDPIDCPKGQQCCGSGKLVINANPMCANYASGFHGTHCAAQCAGNEITMCTSNGECGGKTCVPFKTKGNSVGGCN